MDGILKVFWNAHQQRLRAFWRLLIHLIFSAVIATVFVVPAVLVVVFAELRDSPYEEVLFGFTQGLGILVACILTHFFIDRRPGSDFKRCPRYWWEMFSGFVLGGLLMGTITIIAWSGGWITIDRVGPAAGLDWLELLQWQSIWFILMWLVGWNEEFFSRGIQMRNLAEGMRGLGPVISSCLAVVLSSSLFGLLHAANDNATPFSILSITFAGILLSIAWIRTGHLALAIGLHAGWNYFQGPVFGFAVSGNETYGNLMHVTTTPDSGWITGGDFGPEAGLLGFSATILGGLIIVFWPNRTNKPKKTFWYHRLGSLVRYRKVRAGHDSHQQTPSINDFTH